ADRARVAAAARVVERLEREIERLREAGPRRDLPGRGREARVPDLDRVRQRGQAQRRGGDRLAAAVDPDLRLRRLARDLDLAVLRGELDGQPPSAVGLDGQLARDGLVS